MSVFERIKKTSRQRGISLNELGKKIGLSQNSIYHWKHATPSADNVQKVADVLDVTTDYLLGRDGSLQNEKQKTADLDDDDVLFTYQGKPLSDEDKAIIKRLMNGK